MCPWLSFAFLLALVLPMGDAVAAESAYPARPIRIVVVYPAGGGIDIVTRAVGAKLTEWWRIPIVIDNRPDAGTTVGTALAAKAAPDGLRFS